MAGIIPQVVTEDRASGAQVIDGSLKFTEGPSDNNGTTLINRDFANEGNRKVFTFSCWFKSGNIGGTRDNQYLFSTEYELDGGTRGFALFWNRTSGKIGAYDYAASPTVWTPTTSARNCRDTGWYHIVFAIDTTAPDGNRIKLYINGERDTGMGEPTKDVTLNVNRTDFEHYIGSHNYQGDQIRYVSGYLSQVYFIDGLSLGSEYFGFTDPLTNTWRPKKFKAEGTTYNNGTVWSSGSTVTGGSISNAADGFDGSIDSSNAHCTLQATNTDTTANVTFAVDFKNVTKVEVFVHSSSSSGDTRGTCETTNGVTFTSPTLTNASQSFHTIYEGEPITLKNIGWGINQNGATGTTSDAFRAFRINDEILIDSTTRNLSFGTNGFYFPLDGNSPIGQDKSGNGNDWTPINFGGSVSLEKATGALPILNTVNGGTQAGVGVRTASEGFPGAEVNDGTVWSSDMDGTLSFSDVAKNAFDGDLSNTQTRASGIVTFTFPKDVPFSSTVNLTGSLDNGGGQIYVKDGTDSFVNVSNEDGGFPTGSSVETKNITSALTSPIKAIKLDGGGGSAYARMTGIEVDGEVLIDGHGLLLALPLVGNSDDVSNQINSSSSTKTVTENSAVGITTLSNFYRGSYYFNGSSTLQLGDLNGGTNIADFTFESWIYLTDTDSQVGFFSNQTSDNASNTMRIGTNGSSPFNKIWMKIGSSSLQPSATLVAEKWFHLAVTRSGSTVTIFIDGVSAGTMSTSEAISPSGFYLGVAYPTTTFRMDGYMQDVRFYKTAKYTKNFIPASTSPDILPETPSGVSGGSKLAKITDGAVAFDGSGDYLDVGSGSDYQFGTGDFTFEGYFYANNFTNRGTFIDGRDTDNTTGLTIGHETSGQIRVYMTAADGNDIVAQSDNFSTKKWTHVAVSRDSGTVRLFVDGILQQSATRTSDLSNTNNHRLGYRHYSSSSFNYFDGFMSNVRIVKGTALYTSNFTPPTRTLTNVTNTKLLCCQSNTSANLAAVSPATFSNDGTVWSSSSTISSGSNAANKPLTNGFDGSISTAFEGDTSGATVTVPVSATISAGGVRVYAAVTSSNPLVVAIKNGSTTEETINTGSSGGKWYASSSYSGPITSLVISRTGRAPEFNAIEINGCVLVDGISGEAIQRAGNSAATNFNPFNTDINTVRGQETGYCTWNPLDTRNSPTLSNGNLSLTAGATIDWQGAFSTIEVSSGKWYFESTCSKVNTGSGSGGAGSAISIRTKDGTGANTNDNYTLRYTDTGYFKNGNHSDGNVSVSGNTAVGDVIGIAFDADLGSYNLYINGIQVSSGSFSFDNYTAGDALRAYTAAYPDNGGYVYGNMSTTNFGQKPFKFPPPDDYQPLNAANVRPETVIARSDQYVGVTTYYGNGGTQQIDYGFQPDLVFGKPPKATTGGGWNWVDSVRGNKYLASQNTNTEQDFTGGNGVTFNATGMSLVDTSNGDWNLNGNPGGTYVGSGGYYVYYGFKAGGNKGTFNIDDVAYASASAAGLDGGSIDPSGASIGTKQGFSILKYSGASGANSISHGLSQAPTFIIVKCTAGVSSQNWTIYHKDLTTGDYLKFTDSAKIDYPMFNDSTPNSSTIPLGNDDQVSGSSGTYILYAWHDVPGLQKFGSYTGNGSTDGPFIELGFRPALLITKRYDAGNNNWQLIDAKRDPFNVANTALKPDQSAVEGSHADYAVDFLSNGFKHRTGHIARNGDGNTYIYMAWAEAPSFNLYGGQSNAR